MKFVELKDICQIVVGGDVPREAFSKNKTAEFPVPILSNGVAEKALYGYTNRAKVSEPSFTISARGTIGFPQYQDRPYFPIVRLICLIPNENLSAKFLKYFLETCQFPNTAAAVPQLTTLQIRNLLVPLPPLEVQEKIVHFLDLLTPLIFALETEQAERERQSNFYLNFIFKNIKADGINLKELIKINKGSQLNRKLIKAKPDKENIFPVINGSKALIGYWKENNVKGQTITIAQGGQAGWIDWWPLPFYAGGHCFYLGLIGQDLLNRFLYFALKSQQSDLLKKAIGTTIKSIMKDNVYGLKIPLPSLKQQEKIIQNLDVWNALTFNDLPKEIELRKQQFQYYLNRIFGALNAK